MGDLIELSSYGKNIQENQLYVDKVGVVVMISQHPDQPRFTHTVSWFGVKSHAAGSQVCHPRRDLKHLTNKKP